jgi:hypothetical protein
VLIFSLPTTHKETGSKSIEQRKICTLVEMVVEIVKLTEQKL